MLYEHFRNLIEGSKELQLNAERGAHFVDAVVAPDAVTFKHIFLGAMSRYTWLTNVGLILFYVMIGALLFAVPAWLLQPAGVIATYVLILMFLIRPISDMMLSLPVLRQAGVSLAKLEQLEHAQEGDWPGALDGRSVFHRRNVTPRTPRCLPSLSRTDRRQHVHAGTTRPQCRRR